MSEAAPPDRPSSSKRARIVKRTLVGGGLALGVGLLLWRASVSESGALVMGLGLALSLGAVYELARMSKRERPGLGWALLACWVLSVALGRETLAFAALLREGVLFTLHGYDAVLAYEWVGAALLALIAFSAVAATVARPVSVRPLAARGLAAFVALWTIAWAAMFFSNDRLGGLCLDDTDMGFRTFVLLLAPAAVVGWYLVFLADRGRMRELVLAGLLAPWAVLPLPWMWHVWDRFEHGGLIALIVLAKIGDVAGYYVGSAIGKRHPFPNISPRKTVAGCWGSLVVGTAAGGALVAAGLLPDGPLGIGGGLLAGAATNLAAQAGDLLESWVKRRARVKDSGAWFGPSGGVLDLVDSLLLAVPAALLVWPWVLT